MTKNSLQKNNIKPSKYLREIINEAEKELREGKKSARLRILKIFLEVCVVILVAVGTHSQLYN